MKAVKTAKSVKPESMLLLAVLPPSIPPRRIQIPLTRILIPSQFYIIFDDELRFQCWFECSFSLKIQWAFFVQVFLIFYCSVLLNKIGFTVRFFCCFLLSGGGLSMDKLKRTESHRVRTLFLGKKSPPIVPGISSGVRSAEFSCYADTVLYQKE